MTQKELMAVLGPHLGVGGKGEAGKKAAEAAGSLSKTLLKAMTGGSLELRGTPSESAQKILAMLAGIEDTSTKEKVLSTLQQYLSHQKKYGGKAEVLAGIAAAKSHLKMPQALGALREEMGGLLSSPEQMFEPAEAVSKGVLGKLKGSMKLSPGLQKGVKFLGGGKNVAGGVAVMAIPMLLQWIMNRFQSGQREEAQMGYETDMRLRQLRAATSGQGAGGESAVLDAQLAATQQALLQRMIGSPMAVSSEETI